MDYKGVQKYTYEYILEGLDDGWNEGGKDNKITYTSLAPGDYVFKVRAQSSDGFWSAAHALEVHIAPPYWQQLWFRILIPLLILIAIASGQYSKSISNQEAQAKLEAKVKERTRQADESRREAEKANAAKTIFLANMSHEIRTPMNGVLGMLELLHATELNTEQQELLNAVQQSGENLLFIINDILDFTKTESEKITLESVPFHIRTSVENILVLFTGNALSKQLELNYVIEPDVPSSIRGDEVKLKQILGNLIGNALKFTKTGGVFVHVSKVAQAPDGSAVLRFSVKDTGMGIGKERQASLFEPFTQVDASTTRKFGGTGLGLAISKRFCELMGGTIGVNSEDGKGAEFYFTIKAKASKRTIEDIIPPPELIGKTALICDVSKNQVKGLKSLFDALGMKTIIQDNFDSAIFNEKKNHRFLYL